MADAAVNAGLAEGKSYEEIVAEAPELADAAERVKEQGVRPPVRRGSGPATSTPPLSQRPVMPALPE